jgi:tetratricopeptide (TPR) repeat protein
MNFKIFTSFSSRLVLVLASTLVGINSQAASAKYKKFKVKFCTPRPCSQVVNGIRTGTGSLPPDALAKLEKLVKFNQATSDEYVLLANHYKAEKNYDQAKMYYIKALELAKTNRDVEGQALANRGYRLNRQFIIKLNPRLNR